MESSRHFMVSVDWMREGLFENFHRLTREVKSSQVDLTICEPHRRKWPEISINNPVPNRRRKRHTGILFTGFTFGLGSSTGVVLSAAFRFTLHRPNKRFFRLGVVDACWRSIRVASEVISEFCLWLSGLRARSPEGMNSQYFTSEF